MTVSMPSSHQLITMTINEVQPKLMKSSPFDPVPFSNALIGTWVKFLHKDRPVQQLVIERMVIALLNSYREGLLLMEDLEGQPFWMRHMVAGRALCLSKEEEESFKAFSPHYEGSSLPSNDVLDVDDYAPDRFQHLCNAIIELS